MKNKRMKIARIEKDFSQEQLADAVGVTRQTIGLKRENSIHPCSCASAYAGHLGKRWMTCSGRRRAKMKKIDERQHIDLLKSEQAAFWAMWLILLISIIVQSYILERDVREYAWELAAFITGCIVSIFGTTRKGIWDTWLKPCMKNYFLASLAGTVVFTVIFVIGRYRNNEIFREDVMGTLVPATIIFASVQFVMIFTVMALTGVYSKHREQKMLDALEKEMGDEMEDEAED